MSKKEKAVTWALGIADDPAHGYDQSSRWGPNYDCSSLVITAWERAGVPVKSRGATYTGNMRSVFKSCGFVEVTDGSKIRGDVLLNERNHTAMFIGDGKIVQASINEKGTVTGGASGDQTGREIYVRDYYDYPWDCILRYAGDDAADYSGDYEGDVVAHDTIPASKDAKRKCRPELPELSEGDKCEEVKTMQMRLIYWGYDCGELADDGDFGSDTGDALEAFQRDRGLVPDRICGAQSWPRLIGG